MFGSEVAVISSGRGERRAMRVGRQAIKEMYPKGFQGDVSCHQSELLEKVYILVE